MLRVRRLVRIASRVVSSLLSLLVFFQPASASAESIIGSYELERRLIPVTGEPPPSVDLDVPFEFDSARLTDQARQQLDALGQALSSSKFREMKIEILGHTDASGSDTYNLNLSQARADAVRDYLMQWFALGPSKLIAQGMGETDLLPGHAPTADIHRRVEIVVHHPDATGLGSVPQQIEPGQEGTGTLVPIN